MKHPERVEDYLQHIAQAIQRATLYIRHLENAAARPSIPRKPQLLQFR